ncbi:MAG: hypothetical protein IKA79_00290, partial [Lentisphaeria bacterium]|nr:hypothetical protein [Lentisphaeria bacterium]
KIQKLQKIQGISPETKTAGEKKEKDMSAPAGDLTDNISENFDKFELWFIDNGKKIFAACLAILVIVAAFYTVKYVMEKNRAEVSARFANAESAEKLQTILNENADAPEATAAAFSLAADYAKKKEYDKAIALYTRLAQNNKDEFLSRKAALNVAYLTEIKGDKNSAVTLFVRIADDLKASEGIRAEAAYAAGRLYCNAKNMASARKYLSLFDTANMVNREAGQWAAMSRALLNRIPAEKVVMAPVVKKAAPAVKKVAPAAKKAAPAVKKVAPAAKKAAPAVKKVAPAARKAAPAVKKAAPAAKKAAEAGKKAVAG